MQYSFRLQSTPNSRAADSRAADSRAVDSRAVDSKAVDSSKVADSKAAPVARREVQVLLLTLKGCYEF